MKELPSIQDMMPAVLTIFSEVQSISRQDLKEKVADYFALSEEQKKIEDKNNRPIYESYCYWIISYFSSDKFVPENDDKLLIKIDTGIYKISEKGKFCLDLKLFSQWYDKYIKEFLGKWTFIKENTSNIQRVLGNIKYLNLEKGYGYVESNGKRYSIQKDHTDEAIWELLSQDLEITFEEFVSNNGKLYTKNIILKKNLDKKENIVIQEEPKCNLHQLIKEHGKFYSNWLSELINVIKDKIPAINDTTDPEDFEDLVFTILKLLGLNEIYQFPRSSQAGKPDGIFRIGNLIVLYDCTLRKDFQLHKDWQIDNYTAKLNSSKISISYRKDIDNTTDIKKKTFQLTNLIKHSWIITRGKDMEIDSVDGICVKEVCLETLLSILEERLTKNYFNEDYLVKRLIEI